MKKKVVITGLGIVCPIGNTVEETWNSVKNGKNGISHITRYDTAGRKVTLAGEVRDLDLNLYINKRDQRKMDRFTQFAVSAAVQAMQDAGIAEPESEKVPATHEAALSGSVTSGATSSGSATSGAMSSGSATSGAASSGSATSGATSSGSATSEATSSAESLTSDRSRWGIILASGIGGIRTIEEEQMKGMEKGFDRVSPYFIPKAISNMAAGHIAIRYGLHGLCSCTVSACASAANAIGDAMHYIRDGYADLMVCGGAEAAITPLSIGGFTSLKALSVSQDPNRASIPFDKERNGFVMGEGAGALVLEEEEHAKARGAHIYGEVSGYGVSCDAYHITAPRPDGKGAAACMRNALIDAGMKNGDIAYINAHGTSTKMNDSSETMAIKDVFAEKAQDLKISSTKSMTGHLLGASAAVEAVITVKAMEQNFLPPTIGYQVPDPECDLDIVPGHGYEYPIPAAMSNSFGFGGHNVSLVFRK